MAVGKSSEADAVAFLALARSKDQAVLAMVFDSSASKDEKAKCEKTLASMLELRAATVYAGWKDSCPVDGSALKLYAMADSDNLCIAVAGIRDDAYPERVAMKLLKELAKNAKESQGVELLEEARPGTMTKPLRNTMKDLLSSYSSATKQDKTSEVNAKVDDVKGIMQDNIKKVLETHTSLDELQSKSQGMSSNANAFLKQSETLKSQALWRNRKIQAIMGACGLGVVGYGAYAAGLFA